MKILTIIPTKLDSKRLKNKNIRNVNGKPMFLHSVEYASKSKHNVTVLVSTESDIVKTICDNYNITYMSRSTSLCGDVEVVDVYLDIINKIKEEYDLVVCLQPDNPNRSHTFDECIDYMVENDYDDLITVNPSYKRSGSVRIFKYKYLKSGQVSKRLGCIKDDAIDIHYESDLKNKKLVNMAVFGKKAFGKKYQKRVGYWGRELLHNNSKELVSILNKNNIIKDNMSIFEMGSGGARNLYYIWKENNTVKLYANDLHENASRNNMHPDIKNIITFYEGDSEEIFNKCQVDNLDLLLVSDHFMHLQYDKADKILKNILTKWSPKHIMLREVKKKFESPHHPKLFHDYAQLLNNYNLISDTTSPHAGCNSYFIWLLELKN